MSSVRAFLAIPLPPALQDAIRALQKELGAQLPEVRWTRPENLHLTLHFFGEISQESLEKIKVSVLCVKGCQAPFSVAVGGLGAFPGPRRPRVIWLGLDPAEQLRQLHGNCAAVLRKAGIVTEPRPYMPHLTIGRLKQQQPDLSALCAASGKAVVGRLPVDRLVLYESRLQPGGAEHIPLMTVNLEDETDVH